MSTLVRNDGDEFIAKATSSWIHGGAINPSLVVAVIVLAIHFSLNSYYNFMRDELYFIECGKHLDWGYVDIGPLAMWLGRLSREMMGDSPFAFRFFPALSHAATVIVVGYMAMRMGAGRWGQFIAALSVLIAPVWLLGCNVLSLPAFEPLFWSLAALFLLLVIQTGNSRHWVGLGIACGLGLLNKPSMAFFGMGLVVGLLATPNRKYFKDKWFYISGLIAFLIAAPYIYWQTTHDWATLQFLVGMNRGIMSRIPAVVFALGQALYIHPLNILVWGGALIWLFASEKGKPYRIFGWIFLTVFFFLLIAKSKLYYSAPAYPMLLAAGGAALDSWVTGPRRGWIKFALPAAMLATGAVNAPMVLPILPIEKTDGYIKIITGGFFANIYELTNTFHDMYGWENHAKVFAEIYNKLTPEEKADCMIFGGNFGRAGALDFYGPKYGLPPASSFHQNYYFWGPPRVSGNLAIISGDKKDIDMFYESAELAGVIESPMAVKGEQHVPVYLCRGIKVPLQQLWETARPRAFLN